MPAREKTIVMTYDIAAHSVRRRVAKILEERMVRVQKSVFEARMRPADARRLFDRLDLLLEEGDSLRMYVLNTQSLKDSIAAGGAPMPEDGRWWLL